MKNKRVINVAFAVLGVLALVAAIILTINLIAEPAGYKCEEQRITTVYPDGKEPKTTTECLRWTKE